jgi:REP element-mobilizing transposase RayT
MNPLAFHLIWTTYGAWLPGDARGWVQSGTPGVQMPDPKREQQAREHLAESPVVLSPEQRSLAEQTIREHAGVRRWTLLAVNARSNHVHIVVTCDGAGERARDQFKLWTSRRLSEQAGLTAPVAHKAGRRHWWTEGGDCLPICDEQYLANAVQYVMEMQGP